MANLNKRVRAVAPFIHPEFLNFKMAAYNAWKECGGGTALSHYPWRTFHGPVFRHELPSLWKSQNTAMLMFVEPVSISFDTFPYYATHEIIPMIWDCWPCYYDKMERWLKKHNVRTAIFTSKQEMEEMVRRVPGLHTMHCPEAVDTTLYDGGVELRERSIDVLEFGRSNEMVITNPLPDSINHVCTKVNGNFIFNNEELYAVMGDAKVVIAFPRSMTDPEGSGGVETLTQRYWENMLSRNVIVGHAPRELVDLIGYNPVIELTGNPRNQIIEILDNVGEYQEMVDKNRKVALEVGGWTTRMKSVQDFLEKVGYII